MIRVLVVDDEPMLLTSARIFLEQSGVIRCETCASGAEALEKLPGTSFDAIVSDYEMPGMDGIQLLKEVRRRHPDLPFILFTGRGREEVVIDALNHGADFYVQKGFDPETQFAELIHKIKHAVERARIKLAYQKQTDELTERMKELDCLYRISTIFQEVSDPRKSIQNVVDVIPQGFQFPGNTCARISLDGESFSTANFQPCPDALTCDIRIHGMKAGLVEVCYLGERPTPEEDLFLKEELMLIHSLAYRIGRVIERTLAEEALSSEKERLKITLRSIGDGVIVTDTGGRVVSLNTVAEELTGWEEREAAGRPLTEVFHIINEKTGELCENPADKVIRTGQIVGLANHTALIARDGTLRVIADSGAPIKDSEGRVIGVVLVFRDVTQEKRAEEERLRLASIVDSSSDAIFGTNLQLIVSSWNRAAERIYGYAAEEAIGLHVSELAPPDRRSEFQGIVNRIREGKRVEHFETERIRKTGEKIHVAVTVSPLVDGEGDIIGYSAISRDITEKKIAEQQLQESRERLNVTLRSIGDGVIVTDTNGRVVSLNAVAEDLTGWQEHEAAGRPLTEVFHIINEKTGRLCENPAEKVIRTGQIVGLANHTALIARDGTLRVIADSGAPIKDARQNTVGVVLVFRDVTSEKRAEEERLRLASIVDSSNDAIFGTTLELHVSSWNKGAERIYGYAAEEAIGRHVSAFAPQDRRTEFQSIVDQIREGKRVEHFETVRVRKTGEMISVAVTVSPLIDEDGDIIGYSAISRDITEKKRVEEELRESENHYRTIFETTGTAMMIVGKDGTISLANAEFERLFGYPRGELEGRKFWKSFFVPEEHEKLRLWHHLRRKDPSAAPRTYESRLVDRTGCRRDILMTVSLIPGTANSVVSIIDITGRKDAERALRESGERLNLIIDGAELATVDWNVVTGAIEVNERWATMTGHTLDEIDTNIEAWKRMLHPDDRARVLNTLQEHLDGKTPHYETINRLPSREGGWIWVHDMGKVVSRDGAGRPLRMVGISRDVTGVRKYQEALNEANKKLSLLASITRHDILNQVTGISGLVAILRKKDVSDEQKREFFDHIEQALTTIGKQIAFTRDYQDLGVHSPGWQPLSELFKRAASNTPLRSIRFEVDTGTVEVFADPLLQRVFYNLLENSLRHGEDVTTIRVTFHENNHQAKLVVEDDGVGIPAAQKDGIFLKGVGKNKGYGLFLAREILDITGMSIIENGEEGRGARFEIVIPRGKYRIADSLPD